MFDRDALVCRMLRLVKSDDAPPPRSGGALARRKTPRSAHQPESPTLRLIRSTPICSPGKVADTRAPQARARDEQTE